MTRAELRDDLFLYGLTEEEIEAKYDQMEYDDEQDAIRAEQDMAFDEYL